MMSHLLMSLMIMLLLSACGKTGELYLPATEQGAGEVKAAIDNSALQNQELNRGSL